MKYIREVVSELKQTTWLKPPELGKLLIYTIVICAIIAMMAFGLDFIFMEIRKIIL